MKNRGIRKPFEVGQRYGAMICTAGPFGDSHPYFYEFFCDCGSLCQKSTAQVKASVRANCGCLARAAQSRNGKLSTTHGMTTKESPNLIRKLHSVHWHMKMRCYNPDSPDYRFWGARGIKICPEWHDPLVFADWALSSGYKDRVTIERIDVNGDYCPENCTWIPNEHQARNTRRIRWLEYDGRRMSVADWSREKGISYRTIMSRLRYGFPMERVLGK